MAVLAATVLDRSASAVVRVASASNFVRVSI